MKVMKITKRGEGLLVEVFAVDINSENDMSKYCSLMNFIDRDKQDLISKYKYMDDVKRSLIADILVRTVACNFLNIKNRDIVMLKNSYGKPYLKGYDNFHFNVSHSGNWVVCAVDSSDVGIDIENIKPIDFNVAKRFFSETEYNDLMNKTDSERLEYFYELWTLKESYIKAIGRGLSVSLNTFSFSVTNDNIHFITDSDNKSLCFNFKQYNIDKNYKMAVCSTNRDFCSNVIMKSVSELYNEFLMYAK